MSDMETVRMRAVCPECDVVNRMSIRYDRVTGKSRARCPNCRRTVEPLPL